jgi:quercetin 2,3-dioxygenase
MAVDRAPVRAQDRQWDSARGQYQRPACRSVAKGQGRTTLTGRLERKEVRSMSQSSRPVAQVRAPEPVVEGAGVHLRRSIGTRALDHLDPFLLLDHFESANPSDYEAGFPYHPHRGIETVTLVRQGEVQHRDSLGHQGTIGAGDIQWMTSGSGILHEEMPQVRPHGIAGLQLWLNLPAREKMSRPKYRDLQANQLTETEADGGAVIRVIAGEAGDGRLVGPVEGLAVAPKFVDVTLPAGTRFREAVPRGHTAFAYVDHGEVRFGPEQTPVHGPALVVFADGDIVEAAAGAAGGRFLLAAARPLHEPIARYGPFVMNTRAEIEQTLQEIRTGRFIRDEPRDE